MVSHPLAPETHRLVGTDIGQMKRTAYLVNVARGEVIDDDALVAALCERRIGGAALDVFTERPLPRDHSCLALDNVVLTPHVAGLTVESLHRMSKIACEETVRILRGKRPVNLVHREVWAASSRRGARGGGARDQKKGGKVLAAGAAMLVAWTEVIGLTVFAFRIPAGQST